MEWKDVYPADRQPTLEDMSDYMGNEAGQLWQSLVQYMDTAYKAKPKLSYSICAGKPGWNVKFQKSGQSFGTLYPEKDGFSVFIVFSYKLAPLVEAMLPEIHPDLAALYRQAGDYMKLGKWMMFRIADAAGVEDYKRLIAVKLPPKAM